MIHTCAVNSAIALAQEFDARRLVVDAQPGTPLAEINKTLLATQTVTSNDKEYTIDAKHIVGLSTNWDGHLRGEEILHTNVVNGFVDDIAFHIQSHLKFAKTVVKPIIVALYEEVKKDVASIEVDPYKDIQIVQYALPKPINEPSLSEELITYKNAVAIPELKHMPFNMISVNEIMELLYTGANSVDTAIKEWAATKGETFFEYVYKSVFTNDPSEDSFASLRNSDEALDVCLAVYLICNKMYDTPPAGINMTMGNYNTMLHEFKSNAALKLCFCMEEYAAFVKTGLLIKNYNPKQITVIADVYTNWIAAGGNNAYLLASALLPTPILHASQLDEDRAKLQQRWERHLSMLNTTETNKKYVKYREILKARTLFVVAENFENCYANLKKENLELNTNLPEYIQFKDKLNEYVYSFSDKDLDNLWEVCLRIITECVFFYTDAGKILKGIEESYKHNPKLEINEAALLSVISYISDYVFDQMSLSGV